MATRTREVGKSKNKRDRGRKMVEEPKPAIVPTISEKTAAARNSKSIAISRKPREIVLYLIGEELNLIYHPPSRGTPPMAGKMLYI